MTPSPPQSQGKEDEIEYYEFMQYIFSEEPYHTDFKVNSALISFFIYHNESSCNVSDEMLNEFDENLDCHGLIDRG